MASEAQQQRSDRILTFLTSKGLQGCPVCSQGQFSVGPEHVLISTPDPNAAEGSLVEGSAVVPVMCANCGYTMLFSPRMMPDQGNDGTWKRMHALHGRVRVRLKRNPQPSAGIVDSQSVKTTGVGGEERGHDGAKKVKGRKLHLPVDR